MLGFCNGLATVIGLAQVAYFHGVCADGDARRRRRRLGPFDTLAPDCGWKQGPELLCMLLLASVAMVVMEYFPKLPMPHKPSAPGLLRFCWYLLIGFSKLPSSFLAILSALVLEFCLVRPLGFRTQTIGDIEEFTQRDALPMPFFLNPEYDMSKLTTDQIGTILLQVPLLWAHHLSIHLHLRHLLSHPAPPPRRAAPRSPPCRRQGALLCCVGSIESLMTAQVGSSQKAHCACGLWAIGVRLRVC